MDDTVDDGPVMANDASVRSAFVVANGDPAKLLLAEHDGTQVVKRLRGLVGEPGFAV
jgi:hypothetical protein